VGGGKLPPERRRRSSRCSRDHSPRPGKPRPSLRSLGMGRSIPRQIGTAPLAWCGGTTHRRGGLERWRLRRWLLTRSLTVSRARPSTTAVGGTESLLRGVGRTPPLLDQHTIHRPERFGVGLLWWVPDLPSHQPLSVPKKDDR